MTEKMVARKKWISRKLVIYEQFGFMCGKLYMKILMKKKKKNRHTVSSTEIKYRQTASDQSSRLQLFVVTRRLGIALAGYLAMRLAGSSSSGGGGGRHHLILSS
mgnify:CR=1 FL=1